MNINSTAQYFTEFEALFEAQMAEVCRANFDPSHDLLHVKRVVAIAKQLAVSEGANLNVVVPAAYLHDCVYIAKSDSRRKQASTFSADRAVQLLAAWNYASEFHDSIHHAIAAHSFSAEIEARSLEAKIVQDADRLDGIGAFGVARCFSLGGTMSRSLYRETDPFCETRNADDSDNTLDHFFVKLLKLHEKMNTDSAKREGERRLKTMSSFLNELKREWMMSSSQLVVNAE